METTRNVNKHRGRTVWRAVSVITLGSVTAISAASTSEECANLVPVEDRRRGKGAFFSGCTDRSTSGRGGCWSSLVEEHSGCQSCIVQGSAAVDAWASSVFSNFFEVELDPCPPSIAELYGTPEGGVVSFEELQSAECGDDGWFSFEASCYSKSSYLDAAITWEDADARCGEMGARLVSMESERENAFVVENLLWIGFLGEAYTGLRKMSADGDWSWTDSLAGFPPGDFDPISSYQDWGAGLNASSFYESTGASCLEITPYLPKTWNPFSCEVNKQYVCEKPAEEVGIAADATPAPSTSLVLETPAPSDEVTTAAPSQSSAPAAATTTPPTLATSPSPRSIPNAAPTAVPTPATHQASPAPSSTLAPTLSGEDGEQGPPQRTDAITGAPAASSSTGSEMPSFSGPASTEFPAGSPSTSSPTWSPTGSPTGSPTPASDMNGAGKLRVVGMEVRLLAVLLLVAGAAG